jgi:uncharacterized membrane protein
MPAARGIAGGARVAIEDQAETETEGEAEESGTGRLEAFSDGVFAIAVTLLVLQLKVPDTLPAPGYKSLAIYVLHQWPAFLAYFNSFLTILIMWLNHHNIFKLIRRSNHAFIILNGVLLMLITFVNYPTALLAPALTSGTADDKQFATLAYTGTFVVTAVFYNVLWLYATYNGRLLGKDASKTLVAQITREYRFGPLFYLVAFLLAFVSVPASLAVTVLLAVYFALSGRNRAG